MLENTPLAPWICIGSSTGTIPPAQVLMEVLPPEKLTGAKPEGVFAVLLLDELSQRPLKGDDEIVDG
jgi:hypothetical protein